MTGTLSPAAGGLLPRSHDAADGLRRKQAALIAAGGIDACSKEYRSGGLGEALAQEGLRTAIMNIDGGLNLPHIRFRKRAVPIEAHIASEIFVVDPRIDLLGVRS